MVDLKLFYDSQGIDNYICAKAAEPLSRFQVKTLECNEIPGLLAMHGTVMNGVCKLYYDITKMRRLSDVLREGVDDQQARKLLLDILKALLATEEYLLSFTRCVLTPEYVYVKPDYNVGLVYLPYEEKEVLAVDEIRMFYQNILAEYLTDDNDIYFLNLLKYVNKQDFSIAGLMEKLKERAESKLEVREESARQEITKNQKKEFVEESNLSSKKPFLECAPKKEKTEEKKLEKQEIIKEQKNLSGLGFMVPGMENNHEEKGEKKKETVEKEKKQAFLSGLFGGGKKTTVKEEEKTPKSFVPEKVKNDAVPTTKSGEGWSGTVMLENEGSQTEIIGMQDAPRMLHNGSTVILNHFPFRIGNGKKEGMDYVIPKAVISKLHSSIQCSQGRCYIKDENSSNHTYLNGKQIPPYTEFEIESGDVIRLANEEMTFLM